MNCISGNSLIRDDLFVCTLDGPDGSGKSSLSRKIVKKLKNKGYTVHRTFEPGKTEVGSMIRDIILNNEMCTMAETLLYFADRAEHFEKVLSKKKGIVICDRFVDSTYVYQHKVKGVDKEVVDFLYKKTTNDFTPNLMFTVISDLPHAIRDDKFDQAGNDFRTMIQDQYIKLAETSPDRLIVDTTECDWSEYADIMVGEIEDKLKKLNYKG